MWLFLNKEVGVCTSNRYETKAQVWEISAAVVSPVCYYGERMFLIYLYSGAQPLHLFILVYEESMHPGKSSNIL